MVRSLTFLLLSATLLGGCHLVAVYEAPASGDPTAVDQKIIDAITKDLGPRRATDLVADDLLDLDSPVADAQVVSPCVDQTDGATLALYTFEGGSWPTLIDLVGVHPGSYHEGTQKRLYLAPGKTGCGNALFVEPNTVGFYDLGDWYAEIPDSPAWDLETGSIDFWVYFERPHSEITEVEAILSRDAMGTDTNGHFVVQRMCDGALAARLQNGGTYRVCSQTLQEKTWHYVGINFGTAGLKLYVDGVLATSTSTVKCGTTSYSCGVTGTTPELDGNDNPWVIGGATWYASEGKADKVTSQFGGAIDSLRISRTVRTFSQP